MSQRQKKVTVKVIFENFIHKNIFKILKWNSVWCAPWWVVRRTGKAPVTHVLQPVGDCLATKKQLQPMQPLCDQKLHFSVADQLATGRRQLSLKIGDQSGTGRRLVGDWLPTDWKWVATGRQLVGDWSATGRRWVGDWLSNKQFAV